MPEIWNRSRFRCSLFIVFVGVGPLCQTSELSFVIVSSNLIGSTRMLRRHFYATTLQLVESCERQNDLRIPGEGGKWKERLARWI